MISNCSCCNPRTAAVALGRWCFGIIFLIFGINKLRDVSAFVENMSKPFAQTWLPEVLVKIFGHALPFIEVTLGVLLLLGLFRAYAVFAAAVLLLILTFGQVVLGNGQVVFSNTVYLFLLAGLLFLDDYDAWVLWPRRCGSQAQDETQRKS